jgi:hypothetical protein
VQDGGCGDRILAGSGTLSERLNNLSRAKHYVGQPIGDIMSSEHKAAQGRAAWIGCGPRQSLSCYI